MIAFEQPIEEPKLLKRAVRWALKNRDHIPSLTDLNPKRSIAELTELGRSWQQASLGRMIEVSENGRRSVLFSLDDAALSQVKAAQSRTLLGRIRMISRSDWISISALIVSIIALFR